MAEQKQRFSGRIFWQSLANNPATAWWQRWQQAILVGMFLLITCAPRLVTSDQFFIQDEHLWINRAQLYTQAMLEGDLKKATAFELQNHPAITLLTTVGPTMEWYKHAHNLPGTYEQWSVDSRMEASAIARWVLGAVASLVLTLLFLALRQLHFFQEKSAQAAAVAAWLGLEPWILGITRTVIVDTLMSLLLVLALVNAGVGRQKKSLLWVALSGAAWGAALISKSPALITLPFIFGLAVLLAPGAWREMLRRGLAWLIGAYLTIIVIWPPFFLHPIERLRGILARVEYHSVQTEAYLWPGLHPPFFLFVLSGLALVGCVLYFFLRVNARKDWKSLLVFDVLIAAGIFHGLVLLYLQGDHARKNLPVIAYLTVAGVIGWLLAFRKLRLPASLAMFGLVILQFLVVSLWWPHLPSYHSELFHSPDGKRLLVDVGNGSRLVADYLNWQAEDIVIATNLPSLVAPYVRPDRRGNIRRLPSDGSLATLDPAVTHIIYPESFPARRLFDPPAAALSETVKALPLVTVLSVRDVPLFSVYRVQGP